MMAVKLEVTHVLVQAQGTCAAFEGRTADLVRRANKTFQERRALIAASVVEPRERD
jgi:hypothetical protein